MSHKVIDGSRKRSKPDTTSDLYLTQQKYHCLWSCLCSQSSTGNASSSYTIPYVIFSSVLIDYILNFTLSIMHSVPENTAATSMKFLAFENDF
jgi:hypothetical protein